MAASKTMPRSLAHLRARGFRAFKTEHWNSFAHIRQDFAGFADILAFHPGLPGVLAVQTTTTGNESSRVKKIVECENAKVWLQAKNHIEVHGWAKRGAEGTRKLWTLNRRTIHLAGEGFEVLNEVEES